MSKIKRLLQGFREHFWFYLFIASGTAVICFAQTVDVLFNDWTSPVVKESLVYKNELGTQIEESELQNYAKQKKTVTRTKQTSVDFGENRAFPRFWKLTGIETNLGFWGLAGIGAFLVFFGMVLRGYAAEKKNPEINHYLIFPVLTVMIAILAVFAVLFAWGWSYLDYRAEIKAIYASAKMDPNRILSILSFRVSANYALGLLVLLATYAGAGFSGIVVGLGLCGLADTMSREMVRVAFLRAGITDMSHRYWYRIRGQSVEVIQPEAEARLLPFPRTRIKEKLLRAVPLAEFWRRVSVSAQNKDPREYAATLSAALTSRLEAGEDDHLRRLYENVIDCVRRGTETDAPALSREVLGQTRVRAEGLLQSVSDRALGEFREDILRGALQYADEELAPFREAVLLKMRESIVPLLNGSSMPISTALPPGTKFTAVCGNRTLIVIEQEPHVRTVRWEQTSLRRQLEGIKDATDEMRAHIREPRFEIAMPYTIYALTFKNNKFARLRLYCKTRPMLSPDDEWGLPPLPHLRSEAIVCLGTLPEIKGTIAEQTEQVLVHFWGSAFNLDDGGFYLDGARLHPDLRHIWAWEQATKQDPKFILEANFFTPQHTNLKDFWNDLTSSGNSDSSLYDETAKRALRAGEIKLRSKILGFLSAVSVEQRYSREIREELDRALSELAAALAERVAQKARQVTDSENTEIKTAWHRIIEQSLARELRAIAETNGTAAITPAEVTPRALGIAVDSFETDSARAKQGE